MSNTQKKNVPELRFPGFEGEWEEKRFADFTKINQGLQIAINERKTEYSPELYFYITNEFLRPNSQTKYFIENPPQSVIANKEDILMTRTGNTGKVVTNVFGAFHNNFFKIKFDKNLYDRLFLVEVLNSSKIQNKILSLAGSSTIPDLNHSDFYSISSSYPLLREQQKIGQFFSKLDRQIELEEQKLELLQQQKKGYMQKIFSQELRFKDENGNDYPEWEEKMIKDVYEITRGLVLSKKLISKKTNDVNKYPVYSSQTTNNGLMGYYSDYLYKDSITWTTDGANAGSVSYRSGKFYCTNVCGVLINEKGNSNLCMSEMLNSIAFKHVSKVGNPKLMNNVMAMVKLNFPCIEEQLKIARFIEAVEKNIINQERKIDLLKQVKNGLLQKMFI
ncbi:restriction endonuclease subunit S [Staphylococcus aureus]|uniref:restriction endonuclease subunit S n=1 Tax=Staphylococcus aureus TaxID=1280 RepID=UPI0020309D0D|nr:restriction endonuclease subunit S [Staphylococcus aureus]MCM0451313.1 restriction endonuclease subunit S [Staphylococcus aureus]MCM0456503.1 restriction endonuclease subunit S [Staphylococcus aureus]MCM0461638.1 restriction endonuclease subunit S [Staphylococcus aureus]MCM0464433.1 restriction endonuclease subunit S [Staphylococcus aureus]MCM0469483.1 restriction endonuclease subunit S [Staphylococcus aureus]